VRDSPLYRVTTADDGRWTVVERSGKTTKAGVYGTTVVDEAAFWTALGVVFE
jgi:hypothetical protein